MLSYRYESADDVWQIDVALALMRRGVRIVHDMIETGLLYREPGKASSAGILLYNLGACVAEYACRLEAFREG